MQVTASVGVRRSMEYRISMARSDGISKEIKVVVMGGRE